ncbi:MAG: hypothetical protein OXH64_11055 [Rhodospirillaceae bacterium]|nr:hypothetical protein [Rhodospirillaceae bacterium]
MPDPAAWQAFAGVLGVLILLGAAAVALKRLGIIRPPAAQPPAAADGGPGCHNVKDDLTERVHKLERELDAFRLHVAESYLRREDYISAQSRIIGLLESHGVMLARLEERIGGPHA